MKETFAQKILRLRSGSKEPVRPGQIVMIRPHHLLSHDNTAAIIGKIHDELNQFGLVRPDLPIIVLDHVTPAANEKTATNHQKIREFVKRFAVPNFFDVGKGICHQIVMEKGFALPGRVIVGSDSHTCSYGALNVFATGIDRTEAAALMLMGQTWFKVPQTIKISLRGRFHHHVSAKDLILNIIGDLGAGGATYAAVEFHGELEALTMDDRFTIANMGIEMGAKVAAFPVDDVAKAYLKGLGHEPHTLEPVWADEDAEYLFEKEVDLHALEPMVACPHKVDQVKPASELKGTRIHQVLIGTCTNGRLSDLETAAHILSGKTVSSDVRLLILPASREIFEAATDRGLISILSRAGAVILPPGCGPCLGAHQGTLAPGEVCLSTANRNFKGRMGCKESEIYLASPATAALSAIHGHITAPEVTP